MVQANLDTLRARLQEVVAEPEPADRQVIEGLVEEVCQALDPSPGPGEPLSDYTAFAEDLCASYDDMSPTLSEFLLSNGASLTREQKARIIRLAVVRYCSHEPGGRTGILRALATRSVQDIPSDLLPTLLRRAADATLDRTFLPPWQKHVELVSKLLERIVDETPNPELTSIGLLRLEELRSDERREMRQAAKEDPLT